MTNEQEARRLAAEAEQAYAAWRITHPLATTLDQLAAVYRFGTDLLRKARPR